MSDLPLSRMPRVQTLALVLASLSCIGVASASDWPCYRADAARSAKSPDTLEFPLGASWVYRPAQAPQPAWPDPINEPYVMDFDAAFQPVVADGLVLFGSSADDCVRALDVVTGTLKWRFATGGPVRFAPAVFQGAVYVASDDGWLYCLDEATGREKWRFQGALNDRRVVGNNRLVSRWPLRSGVLVEDGVAYFTAGMWPSEGVFVYAVDARTGKQLWINDTSAISYCNQPHWGAAALTGLAPQGYLAVAGDALLVPTGRGVPGCYDRRSGALRHLDTSGFLRRTGAWIAVDTAHSAYLSGYDKRSEWRGVVGGRPVPKDRIGELTVVPPRQVRAGDVTIHGGDGAVFAVDAGGDEIWRQAVEGEARGLAIANRRLIVSTSTGRIYCFVPAKAVGAAAPRIRKEAPAAPDDPPDDAMAREIVALADKHRLNKGYALLAGVPDSRTTAHLASRLAAATELHVVVVADESSQVAEIRSDLLDHTALHGLRIAVVEPGTLSSRALPPYFANMVVVVGAVDAAAQKDLYRVLRPCGGVMAMLGLSSDQRKAVVREAGVPAKEVQSRGGSTLVVRGKIEGAFDWDSEVTCDQRLKWPLELLWFGQPGPAEMANRHLGPPMPVAANGRILAVGEHCVFCLDAYNGTLLWKRDVPGAFAPPLPTLKNLAGDDESVYMDFGDVAYQLDAQTGAQQKVYGEFKTPKRFSLASRQVFDVPDAPVPAQIAMERTTDGLRVALTVDRTEFEDHDGWELFFDFRPADRRMNLYEPGVFQLAIQTKTAQLRPVVFVETNGAWDREFAKRNRESWGTSKLRPGVGPVHPKVALDARRADSATTIVMTMPWDEVRRVAGRDPDEFAFAGTLVCSGPRRSTKTLTVRVRRGLPPGDPGPMVPSWGRTHLFGDEYAGVFNNGWAIFMLDDDPEPAATRRCSPRIAKRSELPERALRWGRMPSRPGKAADGVEWPSYIATRKHPLFGTESSKRYTRAYGCGGVISSASMDFFRSGTIGFYDYTDDSGVRNFGGVKPSCGDPGSMMPALGVLVVIEGSSYCVCSYNFQTSLALAPALRRSNEDWATFDDKAKAGTPIKQFHINLGAPGDRRDDQGALWLNYPRPASNLLPGPMALPFPIQVVGGRGFGTYRFSAERRMIQNTDKPWLYASGYRDVSAVEVPLTYCDPDRDAMAFPCETPPAIDGALDDACWQNGIAVNLPERHARVQFRYDATNLYVAYDRPAALDSQGRQTPLHVGKRAADGPVWKGDCLEMYFGDRNPVAMLHFAVSAAGVRYDGFLPEFGAEVPVKKAKGWDDLSKGEDASWDADWQSAARMKGNAFAVEVTIPWSVLESKGLNKETMYVNFRGREKSADRLYSPTKAAHRLRLEESVPTPAGKFTVRLHFAEVDDAQPGERVFDVVLQGQTVLKGLDIRAEAGAADTAVVKEFKGIPGRRSIRIEFRPAHGATGTKTVPLLSAIEAVAEP